MGLEKMNSKLNIINTQLQKKVDDLDITNEKNQKINEFQN